MYLFVFDPRCRVPEGQVWTFKRPVKSLHSGSAVYERGEHPVRGGYGAAGHWIQTFSKQEEVCHRYDICLITSTYPILLYLMHQQLELHIFCSFLRTLYGRLLKWPTAKKIQLTLKLSTLRGFPNTWIHLSTVRLLPEGANLTTVKQHWVLNTV